MKKSRYSDEQIVRILLEADKAPIAEMTKRRRVAGSRPRLLECLAMEWFRNRVEAKKWTNPVTKGLEPKSTYIEKVGDVLIGCGIYK